MKHKLRFCPRASSSVNCSWASSFEDFYSSTLMSYKGGDADADAEAKMPPLPAAEHSQGSFGSPAPAFLQSAQQTSLNGHFVNFAKTNLH